MRAALYARVSTEEQTEGYSIDAQLRACRDYSKAQGWTIVAEFVDEGNSARTEDIKRRPKFKEMMEAVRHRDVDVVMVHKLDRFSRNLKVTLESFEELSKCNIDFVSISEQIDYTTPMGKVFLAMSGAFAQFYSDNLSQETKKGWSERRKQGFYCGLLPFGAIKGEDGIPIPDTREIELNDVQTTNYKGLALCFELAAQGKSDREVAEALNAVGYRTAGNQGNRPFSKDTVRGMLMNPFYIGKLTDGNGGTIKAKHTPFIEQEMWDQAQASRRRNRKSPKNRPAHATLSSFTGYAYCSYCKGRMHTGATKNGKKRLMCAGRMQGKGCQQKSALLEVYEAQIEGYLESFHIPDDYQEKILDVHKKLEDAYDDVEKKRSALQSRLDRYQKLFGWGDIPEGKYLTEKRKIERQLELLKLPERNTVVLERLASFLTDVAQAWREADHEQRNSLGRQLFEEIWIKDRQVIAVRPRPELEPFFRLSYEEWKKEFESADLSPIGVATANRFVTPLRTEYQRKA